MRIAAITMVRNESVFLPLWLAYYSQQLGRENLFIVDHASDDGSTNVPGINITRLPDLELEERRRALFISRFHASLLLYYDCVIYTDVDEFLIADPADWSGLAQLIASNDVPVLSPIGLNVLHDRSREADVDLSVPILSQRSWAQFDPMYCKPLVSRRIIGWMSGFHFAEDYSKAFHRGLYLFHLKSADWRISQLMRAVRNGVKQSDHDRALGLNAHFDYDPKTHDKAFFGRSSQQFSEFEQGDFKFEKDLSLLVADTRPRDDMPRTINKIPERFHASIPGVPGMPLVDVDSSKYDRRSVGSHGSS